MPTKDSKIKIIANGIHPAHVSGGLPARDCQKCAWSYVIARNILERLDWEMRRENELLHEMVGDDIATDILAVTDGYQPTCSFTGCTRITYAVMNIAKPDEDEHWVSLCRPHILDHVPRFTKLQPVCRNCAVERLPRNAENSVVRHSNFVQCSMCGEQVDVWLYYETDPRRVDFPREMT
jgi:hypothetical protein